jgi:hypothetical protein
MRMSAVLISSLVLFASDATFSASQARSDQVFLVCQTSNNSPPCPRGATEFGFDSFNASFPAPILENLASKFCAVTDNGKTTVRPHNVVEVTKVGGGEHGVSAWAVTCFAN